MVSFSIEHLAHQWLDSAVFQRTRTFLREAFAATPAAIALEALSAKTPDEALRARLLDRLKHEPTWRADESNVLVERGSVTLQGIFERRADRARASGVVRRWPGVRRVTDARVSGNE